jgi:hypothetical protein
MITKACGAGRRAGTGITAGDHGGGDRGGGDPVAGRESGESCRQGKAGTGCIDEAKRREPGLCQAQRGGAEGRSLPLRRGDPGLGEEGGHAGRG